MNKQTDPDYIADKITNWLEDERFCHAEMVKPDIKAILERFKRDIVESMNEGSDD